MLTGYIAQLHTERRNYIEGAFGLAGNKEADDFCIRQLLPNKLKDLYCFKTSRAIECLNFIGGEKICLKK